MSLTRAFARVAARAFARATLDARPADATRGPELVTAPFTSWVSSGAVTIDATGIQFTAAATTASASLQGLATEDNTVYEIIVVCSSRSAGDVTPRVCGDTAGHTGIGTAINAAGTFTQRVTTSAAGSPVHQVRILCTQASTTLKITSVSVKKVLG